MTPRDSGGARSRRATPTPAQRTSMPTTAMRSSSLEACARVGRDAVSERSRLDDIATMAAAMSLTARCSNSRVLGSVGKRSSRSTVISTILNESHPRASRPSRRRTSSTSSPSADAKAWTTIPSIPVASMASGTATATGRPEMRASSEACVAKSDAARPICASRARMRSTSTRSPVTLGFPSAAASSASSSTTLSAGSNFTPVSSPGARAHVSTPSASAITRPAGAMPSRKIRAGVFFFVGRSVTSTRVQPRCSPGDRVPRRCDARPRARARDS